MNGDGLVQMLADQDPTSRQTKTKRLLRDLEASAVESHRVVVVDDAFLLLGTDLVQILSRIRKKGCTRLLGFYTETGIVEGNPVAAEKFISGFNGGDVAQSEFLRQPALPGAEESFATPPGLRGIGQNQFNAQLVQSSCDLCGIVQAHRPVRFRRPRHVTAPV